MAYNSNYAPKVQPKFSVAIKGETYQKLINDTLGDPIVVRQFVADISTVVATNPGLADCEAASILSAGLVAQTLRLPLSSTLGFAYVVPFNTKEGKKAQFQIGWKGLVQLAQRTGLYKGIGVRVVHEGEWIRQDKHGEDIFVFSHEFDDKKIIGYYAWFELTNGFEKSLYWTVAQCEAHARKYSKSYGTGKSTDNWTNIFDDMALKTVLKQLIGKYGPMSVEISRAVEADQAVVNKDGSYDYVDNDIDQIDKKTNISNTIIDENGEVVNKEDVESAKEFIEGTKGDIIQ